MNGSPADAGRHAGLQPERTSLAWQRTALAVALAGVAAARVGWQGVGAWALLPSGILVAGAVVVLLASRRRYLGLIDPSAAARPLDGRLILVATVLTLALGILGVWLVALPPLVHP